MNNKNTFSGFINWKFKWWRGIYLKSRSHTDYKSMQTAHKTHRRCSWDCYQR